MMKTALFLTIICLTIVIAASLLTRTNKSMMTTENEKYLKEAQKRVKEFEKESEPERLREASMALENVVLEQEYDAKIRTRLRSECLNLWLEMVAILDRRLDPEFDPEDVPENLVQPPPTSKGVIYPPGADPALLDDPKAREEYEKAIAANNAKINNYRVQTHLKRLNDEIPPRAAEFITNSYTDSDADQKEVKAAIERLIENPARRVEFSKLLKSPKT
jgi:hypothetical protein